MKNKIEPVINLHFFDPCIITAEEYEAIEKDLLTRHWTDDKQPGDKVLAFLLVMNRYRYLEIKAMRGTPGSSCSGSD